MRKIRFTKIATFFLPKKSFYPRKLSKIEQILQIFLNFSKSILQISILWSALENHRNFA